MIRFTKALQWLDNLLDRAASVGTYRAAAAAMEVKRNADRERVKAAV